MEPLYFYNSNTLNFLVKLEGVQCTEYANGQLCILSVTRTNGHLWCLEYNPFKRSWFINFCINSVDSLSWMINEYGPCIYCTLWT